MKTRVFLDTNIMLDLLGERIPHYQSAARVATLADRKEITMIVSALSFSTVYYILSKFESPELVREKLRKFLIISEISDVSSKVIEQGLNSSFEDFEDALQYYCALNASSDVIISRNIKDFRSASIPVMTADEYMAMIKAE